MAKPRFAQVDQWGSQVDPVIAGEAIQLHGRIIDQNALAQAQRPAPHSLNWSSSFPASGIGSMPGCGQSVPQTQRSGARATSARRRWGATSLLTVHPPTAAIRAGLHPCAPTVEQPQQCLELRMFGSECRTGTPPIWSITTSTGNFARTWRQFRQPLALKRRIGCASPTAPPGAPEYLTGPLACRCRTPG